MNRTVGFAMLLSGILFMICGVLDITGTDTAGWAALCSLNAVLFLGGGILQAAIGILLMQDVHIAPPGSLMVRRGE